MSLPPETPAAVTELVGRLPAIPVVAAVTLGGSRAREAHHPGSDWDFGLYYRGRLDTDAIRMLGLPGTVVEPGDWGRLVNGGAWLQVAGHRVDLLYRDLDVVEHWTAEAERGSFEVDAVWSHVAGLPTYVLAGELALGRVLHGDLPRPAFPEPLRATATRWWREYRSFSLSNAVGFVARGDVTGVLGLLAGAAIGEAHARAAERGSWVLHERGLVAAAGLQAVAERLARPGTTTAELAATVAAVTRLLVAS